MTTNHVHRIAVIPGDGIGKEVVPEGARVLEAAAKKFGSKRALDSKEAPHLGHQVERSRAGAGGTELAHARSQRAGQYD